MSTAGQQGVEALFVRLLADHELLRSLLGELSPDQRRQMISEAGFGELCFDDVRREVARILDDGHLPGRPKGWGWAPGPEETWAEAPLAVKRARRCAIMLGALAEVACPDAPMPRTSARLVNYLVMGVGKGGTTALDYFLSQHPDICTAAPKETHFFCRNVFFQTCPPRYEWYHFCFRRYAGERAVGEATPEYMFSVQAGERIRAYRPSMKLIFVLRNPAHRAYSEYRMAVARHEEDRTFSQVLRDEVKAADGIDGRYTGGGFYHEPIVRLAARFPRRQLLFIRTEDLRTRHETTMTEVHRFLGVAPDPVPLARQLLAGLGPPMAKSDRGLLVELYGDEVSKLETFLGWDLSDWRT